MLRCDEAACSYPQDGLSMCSLCERNVDIDKTCKRQVMNNFVPHVVGDELECEGFVMTKVSTVKAKKNGKK